MMDLLDSNIDEYVINPKKSSLEDKNGNLLGKIKLAGWGYGTNSILDLKDSQVLEFKRKGKRFLKLFFDCYEIKNSSNVLIGKMLKGDSKKSDFLLENVDGDKILKFNLIPSENSAYMYNNSDKLIAKIETHPHKSFLNKIYEEPKSWTLSIHDLSFDRALLLGFCLSIYHFQRATGSGPGA